MSQHWESSARPLFVKTVYVNGNRHAILSQQDPSTQPGKSFLRKQIRSHSSLSFSSVYSSFNTQGSESSESEISFKILKAQPSRSKDISTDLQRCLVKWRLSSALQDSKNQLSINEQSASKILPRRRRKKPNNCKMNKKRGIECGLPEVLSDFNDYKKKVNGEYCKREENFFLPTDVEIYDLKKNNNAENETTGNEAASCEKTDSVLGETLHTLIMRNRNNEETASDKSHDRLYAIANSNTCEMYWNNYLARSFRMSLVERVVQWMDLVKKQRKDENITFSISNVSGRNTSREKISTRNNNYVNKVTEKSNGESIRKSHSEMPLSKQIIQSQKNFLTDHTEILDGDAMPFVNEVQIDSIGFKGEAKTKTEISRVENEEKKQDMENDFIVHQLQTTVSNTPKQTTITPENKTANSRYLKKKKNLPYCQDYFVDKLKNNEQRSKMGNIGVGGILEKRIISARNTVHDSIDKSSIYRGNFKSRPQKSATETMKLNNGGTWMSTALDENYISINKTSLSQHMVHNSFLLEQKEHQQNEGSGTREGKIAWDVEKSLEKPQLHIFIPSISEREVNEFENPSECESF